MILELPEGFTEADIPKLPDEWRLIEKGDGRLVTAWTYNDIQTVLVWRPGEVEISYDADPAQITALQGILAAWGQPPSWSDTYQAVVDAAQSAVGVGILDLTTAQRWALLALLLWDRRAIADDLTVRPLGQWVVRRPTT